MSQPVPERQPPYMTLWGLTAKPSEVMHGLSEGGDRRGGRALWRPQEAIRLQTEAWEVARALSTKSGVRRRLLLRHFYRGGAGCRARRTVADRRPAQLAGFREGGPG